MVLFVARLLSAGLAAALLLDSSAGAADDQAAICSAWEGQTERAQRLGAQVVELLTIARSGETERLAGRVSEGFEWTVWHYDNGLGSRRSGLAAFADLAAHLNKSFEVQIPFTMTTVCGAENVTIAFRNEQTQEVQTVTFKIESGALTSAEGWTSGYVGGLLEG